jgi:AcrR family transcriptional regulator
MPRVRPERKIERRAQIVAAARACFARDGFHRTTLQDVFAEAGLSAGCVYSYFKSKDELILAIAEDRHERERRAVSEGAKERNLTEALTRIAAHFIDDYLTDAGLEKRRIAIQTWSEAMLNPAILASVREGLDGPRREIANLIRRTQRLGRFAPDLDADAVARTMAALFHGMLLQKLWDPKLDVAPCFAVLERLLASPATRENTAERST